MSASGWHVSSCVMAIALSACCLNPAYAQLVQFNNSGPPPDIVGLFVGDADIAAIASDGSFIYQGASVGESPYVGKYTSYQCNEDGSWSAVYIQYLFDGRNELNRTMAGCGTGYFVDGMFTSIFATTDVCPLAPDAETYTVYRTLVPGGGLGGLLNASYCSPLRRGVLDHPILNGTPADATGAST